MSRAAVSARKTARDLERKTAANERFFAMVQYSRDIDSSVVTCDDCGLLQVTRKGYTCFGCGGSVGSSDDGDGPHSGS